MRLKILKLENHCKVKFQSLCIYICSKFSNDNERCLIPHTSLVVILSPLLHSIVYVIYIYNFFFIYWLLVLLSEQLQDKEPPSHGFLIELRSVTSAYDNRCRIRRLFISTPPSRDLKTVQYNTIGHIILNIIYFYPSQLKTNV